MGLQLAGKLLCSWPQPLWPLLLLLAAILLVGDVGVRRTLPGPLQREPRVAFKQRQFVERGFRAQVKNRVVCGSASVVR